MPVVCVVEIVPVLTGSHSVIRLGVYQPPPLPLPTPRVSVIPSQMLRVEQSFRIVTKRCNAHAECNLLLSRTPRETWVPVTHTHTHGAIGHNEPKNTHQVNNTEDDTRGRNGNGSIGIPTIATETNQPFHTATRSTQMGHSGHAFHVRHCRGCNHPRDSRDRATFHRRTPRRSR
jgi:hypothetical protein